MSEPRLTESAQHEIAQLERVAADTGRSVVDRAEALLTAHQRFDVGGCLCGWSQLGTSHAGHQVAVLSRIGLLTADNAGRS